MYIEETKSAPLFYPTAQSKIRKEQSDFAAVELATIMYGLTDDRHGRPEVAPTQFDKQISSGTTTSSPIFYSKNIFHCNISVKNIHLYYDGRQGGSDWTKREEKSSQNLR